MEELRGSGEEWIEGPGVGSMLKTREAVGAIWLGEMDREGPQGGCGRVAAAGEGTMGQLSSNLGLGHIYIARRIGAGLTRYVRAKSGGREK